jgi:tetratricopeptide (TPR) repeat protein
LGKSREAEILLERLLQVAPLDTGFRTGRMWHFFHTRQYERAIAEAERIREFDPQFVDFEIGAAYMLLGQPEDAAREWLALFANFGAAAEPLLEALQRGGEDGGWQGALRLWRGNLIQLAAKGTAFGSAWVIAILSATLGETEETMTWLERAYEVREPVLTQAKVDARLDPLRSDPRFDDLLRRIGFPED